MILSITAQSILLASAQVVGGECVDLWTLNGNRAQDRSGQSVAIAGDVNADGFPDFIVGSSHVDLWRIENPSMAQVFSGADGSLIHEWSGHSLSDYYGTEVAGLGDLNGDGCADLVVGAPRFISPIKGRCGAAFVYSGLTGGLLYQFEGVASNDDFGLDVAAAGDVNGDTIPDIIVGAHRYDNHYGEAYVYSGSDGSLLHQLRNTLGGSTRGDFGYAVGGGADINGDGYSDLVVSEPGPQCAHVFSGIDGSLLYSVDGPYSYRGEFGKALAVVSDADADGVSDILIGNPRGSGKAHLYSGSTGQLIREWNSPGIVDVLDMGCSVAEAGDLVSVA